jgi:hypothetical protein
MSNGRPSSNSVDTKHCQPGLASHFRQGAVIPFEPENAQSAVLNIIHIELARAVFPEPVRMRLARANTPIDTNRRSLIFP